MSWKPAISSPPGARRAATPARTVGLGAAGDEDHHVAGEHGSRERARRGRRPGARRGRPGATRGRAPWPAPGRAARGRRRRRPSRSPRRASSIATRPVPHPASSTGPGAPTSAVDRASASPCTSAPAAARSSQLPVVAVGGQRAPAGCRGRCRPRAAVQHAWCRGSHAAPGCRETVKESAPRAVDQHERGPRAQGHRIGQGASTWCRRRCSPVPSPATRATSTSR